MNSLKQKIFICLLLLILCLFSLFILGRLNFFLFITLAILISISPPFFLHPKESLLGLIIFRSLLDFSSETFTFSTGKFVFNLNALLGILILFWLGILLFKKRKNISTVPCFWPWLVFWFFSLLSLFYSLNFFPSLTEIIKFSNFFLIFLVSYFIYFDSKDPIEKEINKIFPTIIFASLIPSLAGFYQFITKTGISDLTTKNRIFGTFFHPNSFAYWLILVSIFTLIFYLWQNKKKENLEKNSNWNLGFGIGNLFYFFWLIFILFLTRTRGAWITFALTIFLLSLIKYRRALLIGIISLSFFALLFFNLKYHLKTYYQYDLLKTPFFKRWETLTREEDSLIWRINLWKDVKKEFIKNPIFGYGLGTFPEIAERARWKYLYEAREAHNDYIRLAVETGLFGLICYLILIFSYLKNLWRCYTKTENESLKLLSLCLFCLIVSFSLSALGDNMLRIFVLQLTLSWLLGACLGSFKKLASQV